MTSINRNAPDCLLFDSADFIDLGEADGLTRPKPVVIGGMGDPGFEPLTALPKVPPSVLPNTSSNASLPDPALLSGQARPAFVLRRSYGLKWGAIAALLPAACTGIHIVTQSTAVADHEPAGPIEDTRWFIGAGVGLTTLQPDAFCDCLTLSEDNDTSFNLYAGIDISKRFAIEFQYANLGAPSVDFLGTPVGSIDYEVAGLSGLLYLFNSRNSGTSRAGFSGYLKAGAGILMNDSALPFRQEHDTQLWLGAGLEYGVGAGWSVRTEFNSFDTDARQVTASLVKRFGGGSRRTLAHEPAPVALPDPLPRLQIPESQQEIAEVVKDPLPSEPSLPAVELPTVFFDFDRHDLAAPEVDKLDRLATIMRSAPNVKLRIEGHTDALGSVGYNENLALMRAEYVRDYLQQQDIQRERIELLAYGELQPAADNSTESGRAQNRRVEVHLSAG